MRTWRTTAIFLTTLLLLGCGGGSPTEPDRCLRLSGPWRLFVNHSCGGDFGFSDLVTLAQSDCRIEGTGSQSSVSLSGTISGNSLTFQITFSGRCPFSGSGVGSISMDGVSGTFQGNMLSGSGCCTGPFGGSITLLPPS